MRSLILAAILSTCLQLSFVWLGSAQQSSKLVPDRLTFSDDSNSQIGATYRLNGVTIQDGFSSSTITPGTVSAGGDLLKAISDGQGFTVKDFALFPASRSNLDLKELTFVTSGTQDQETWTFGITDVGAFDENDQVQSALSLRYTRVINGLPIFYPLLFVNPEEGNMGMGTYTQDFNAQLYVQEFGQDQIAISANNTSATNESRWGVYSTCQGSGTGIRFGVVGQAFTSSGTRYGVLGTADPDFGYAVYASGNMAYTGTFSTASDQKLKKNIREFTALDRVLRLRPKTYEMKREEFKRMNLASGQRFGFIAQELQEVFPELVREQVHAAPYPDGDSLNVERTDYLGVEYMGLIPILTKATQEQQVLIEENEDRFLSLERENQALERRNQALESRLAQLEALVGQLIEQQSDQENTQHIGLTNARLEQNQPNPFSNNTSIVHDIPATIKEAKLEVSDANGRVLKVISIPQRGHGKTILETDLLTGGTYFYSLILDGKVIDTKKMISVK
ncbi:MAG: tail fiber domain-containing protein [Saprospiraceae bacterium]|nr:tail fiber domain-containing protein [Lewinella sp.]